VQTLVLFLAVSQRASMMSRRAVTCRPLRVSESYQLLDQSGGIWTAYLSAGRSSVSSSGSIAAADSDSVTAGRSTETEMLARRRAVVVGLFQVEASVSTARVVRRWAATACCHAFIYASTSPMAMTSEQ
jgi:hypothetical protein